MNIKKGAISALVLGTLAFGGMSGAQAVGNDSLATQTLSSQVYTSVSTTDYATEGGGYIQGSQLFEQDENGIYTIKEAEYAKLSSAGKKSFVADIKKASDQAKEDGADVGITDGTISNWYKSLSQIDGFGSQLLAELMQNTKADFVTGNAIWSPFSGIFSGIIGFFAILIFALLGLTIVLDLLYIAIPISRALFGDGKDDKGNTKAKFISSSISYAARNAVEQEEGGSGSDNNSGGKSAIWIYIKKSFVKFFMLGLAMVYLVSGQLWYFIGWMLDLIAQTIGF